MNQPPETPAVTPALPQPQSQPPAPPAPAPPAPAAAMPGITPPMQPHGFQRRLGDVIVDLGYASREQVEVAVARARAEGLPTGRVLVEAGLMDSRQLARALAERNGLDYVDLNTFRVDPRATALVTVTEARRLWAIPTAFLDQRTILAVTSEPANVVGIDDLSMMTGFDIRLAVAPPEDIEALIAQLGRLDNIVEEDDGEPEPDPAAGSISLHESASEEPVIKLAHSIIADAVQRGASDIHLEPKRGEMRVRYRIDGVATDSHTVPMQHAAGLVSRVKIMAELDIAERRVPQDGRVSLSVDGRRIDMRVATLPVVRGESVVMRILDKGNVVTDLDSLGMKPPELAILERSLGKLHGAVLATGPTGAGKTTTIYAALNHVHTPDRTLITIEDPVEYELEGVKQVQVNMKAGLSFADGLRSMVRSDPDVLMVGEIRDRETAQIAVESALTGHLVLSTLHTNRAPMAPARLIEMGIEPFLVASAVNCVVAQRLARRLCADCREPVEVSADEQEMSGLPGPWEPFEGYKPVGCMRCEDTGYHGRIGLYEVMQTTDDIRSMILGKASAEEIHSASMASGLRGLQVDGIGKVRDGVTTLPEVLRVVGN